jgi:hypothetical protein
VQDWKKLKTLNQESFQKPSSGCLDIIWQKGKVNDILILCDSSDNLIETFFLELYGQSLEGFILSGRNICPKLLETKQRENER